MDRSPRRAGAAGAASAALRSFTISMAIAIAATNIQVLGFTIRGRHSTVEPASDLTVEASSLLEVKHDIGRQDVKPINDGELHTGVIAINKTENIRHTNETRVNDTSQFIKESAANVTVISIDNNKPVNNRTTVDKDEPKQNITGTNKIPTFKAVYNRTAIVKEEPMQNITGTNETTIYKAVDNRPVIMKEEPKKNITGTNKTKIYKAVDNRPVIMKEEPKKNITGTNETTIYKAVDNRTAIVKEEPKENITGTNETTIYRAVDNRPVIMKEEPKKNITGTNETTIYKTVDNRNAIVEEEPKQNITGTNETTIYKAVDNRTVIVKEEPKQNITGINETTIYKAVDNMTAIVKEELRQNISRSKENTTITTVLMTKIPADNNVGSEILKNVNLVIASTVFANLTTESIPTASEGSIIDYSEEPETSSVSSDGSTTPNNAGSSSPASTDYMYELDTTNTGSTTSEMFTTSEDTYTDISESTTYASTPTWTNYTTIDRKHATTTVDNLHNLANENMVKSETSQTRITLENITNLTPIPSLENLRGRLTINNEHLMPTIREDAYGHLGGMPSGQLTTETTAIKIDMVSSKRGGYLDNTGTSTPHPIEATTVEMEKVNTCCTETFNTAYDTDSSDTDAPAHKTASGVESQRQLVEDAIKEELLKEETINDHKENSNRYSDEGVKSLANKRNEQNSSTAVAAPLDDALNVKPIINDKKINTSLYAVNPNYKPLKKIDVQPSKQFVRDPDDNSWRNESISSLGIVFKPKHSSKSFTQVLKNKTETELNNIDKENKGEVPDLRVRLEKIAEVRKSKKKKTNQFGEVVYTDYDSSENTNLPTNETTSSTVTSEPVTSFLDSLLSMTTPETPTIDPNLSVNSVQKDKIDIFNMKDPSLFTTTKPKKYFNIAEYYDTTDEYDADYLKVTKIDLKKFTKPIATKEITTPSPEEVRPTQLSNYLPARRPTVQYFPPTKKVTPKINVQDYDTDVQSKLNLFTYKDLPNNVLPVSFATLSPSHTEMEPNRPTTKPEFTPDYKHRNMDKNLYLTQQPGGTDPRDGYAANDGNFNRASYVIKHYKDFINEAIKDSEEDRNIDYMPFTQSPVRGITVNELAKLTEKDGKISEEDYEYDVPYRKDLINRFLDNFNQNSERFKVDFPILYNNSVVHRSLAADAGRALASSSAYLRRQYEARAGEPPGPGGPGEPGGPAPRPRPCEPHCDKLSVDLSPDYELHYYIPEQEEKEEMDQRHITPSYRYRNTQL